MKGKVNNTFTSPTIIENLGDTIPVSRAYSAIRELFGKEPPAMKIDDDLNRYLTKCLEQKILTKDEASYLYFYLITLQFGQSFPPIPAALMKVAKDAKSGMIYDKLSAKEQVIAGIFSFNSKEVAFISSFNPYIVKAEVSQLGILEHREIVGYLAPPAFIEEVNVAEEYRPLRKKKERTGNLFTPRKAMIKDRGLELQGEKLFRKIMEEAVKKGATDVHIRPLSEKEGNSDNGTVVDLRVRMALKPEYSLSEREYRELRAFFMSTMRIDDKPFSAVSAASSIQVGDRRLRYRFSQMPSALPPFPDGIPRMSYVIRIHKTEGKINIDSLGIPPEVKAALTDAVTKRAGIIVVSGATGSGKSTTVLSALKYLNEACGRTKKIITLEDPVEVTVPGILQTEINNEAGYTFYTGLREALRHDPDVIFVGEVRDKESAELLLQAAITGHMVLTTVHSFSLEEIPERLNSLGIDSRLLLNASLLYLEQVRLREFTPGSLEEKTMPDGKILLKEPRDPRSFLENSKDRVLFSALRFTDELREEFLRMTGKDLRPLIKEKKSPKINEQLLKLYREKKISTQQFYEFIPQEKKIEL